MPLSNYQHLKIFFMSVKLQMFSINAPCLMIKVVLFSEELKKLWSSEYSDISSFYNNMISTVTLESSPSTALGQR